MLESPCPLASFISSLMGTRYLRMALANFGPDIALTPLSSNFHPWLVPRRGLIFLANPPYSIVRPSDTR